MILFSAEAIFPSSTSKSGVWVPLIEREDLRSSTYSTIFTSLVHSIASVGNCDQVHTSVLNLFFQQANVAGLGNLSKWRSEICSRCWSAPFFFFWKSSITGVERISGWRSWLASRIQGCVWCLAFTRYMQWCMFRHIGNPRIEPLRIRCRRRRCWIYKNVSRYTMRVPNVWRLIVAARHSHRTAQQSTRIGKRWE